MKYNDMELLRRKVAHLHNDNYSTIAPPIQITNGIPQVMVLKGSYREMGFQYGAKLAYKLYSVLTITRAAVLEAHGEKTVMKDMKTIEYLVEKYDPDFRLWIEGVQAGCASKGVDFTLYDFLIAEVYGGERWARPEGKYPEELGFDNSPAGPNIPHPQCNAFAAAGEATKDGEVIVGTSGSNSDETPDRVILICYPDNEPYFICFGAIVSPFCQIGMTSAGFTWTCTANFSPVDCDWGIFLEIMGHYLTTKCKTPQDAQEFLKLIPRVGAVGNLITTDLAGNISVTETNSDHYNIRRPGDAGEEGNYVVSTNHFAAKDTLEWNIPEYALWQNDSKCRFATVSKFLAKAIEDGGIDYESIRKMMRSDDWYDPETNEWHTNEPESMKGYNLLEYTHQVIMHPSDMTAYFMLGTASGTGTPAGSMGEFVKMQILEDPFEMLETMRNETFLIDFYEARAFYRKVLNSSESLQKDYATQEALEGLLDKAYVAYECALNRQAHAILCRHDGGAECDYLEILSEALSYMAESQLYSKKLIAQLECFGIKKPGGYNYFGAY